MHKLVFFSSIFNICLEIVLLTYFITLKNFFLIDNNGKTYKVNNNGIILCSILLVINIFTFCKNLYDYENRQQTNNNQQNPQLNNEQYMELSQV